jgi:arylsulfatase A-like enzyme
MELVPSHCHQLLKSEMKKPNILVFMTDQQNGRTILPDSECRAITPVLDSFREDAVTFSRAYCPAPHCCPSRATFFTGLMPSEHGVWNNVCVTNALSRGLRENVRPWSQDLCGAGYQLHFAGKWHASNHQQPRQYGWNHVHPENMCHGDGLSLEAQERQAYDREIAHLRRHAVAEPDTSSRRPGEIHRPGQTPYVHFGGIEDPWLKIHFPGGDEGDPFNDRTVVDAAQKRLEQLLAQSDEAPWCLFVGTLGPHDPYIPPRSFLDWYNDQEVQLPESFDDPMADKPALYRRTRQVFSQLTREEHCDALRHYLAFCSYEDSLFGNLLATLKEANAYEETLVIFVSDHGDYAGDHGLWCKGLPAFLSAYHIPAVVKMPGHGGPRGVVCDALVSLADFGPTLSDVAGLPVRDDVFGTSLLPFLVGEPSAPRRESLVFQTNGNEIYGIQRSVLTDDWRFVFNGFDFDELYDMRSDPDQMVNLAMRPEFRPVVHEMYRLLWNFALTHGDHLVNDYIFTALADFGPAIASTPGVLSQP